MEKKKITLADVARMAGVSKPAASKALFGGEGGTIKVSAETVLRIRKAAEELCYVPNNTARSLATRRTGVIGYILSDSIRDGFRNSYFNRYLAGVELACREYGYGLYIARSQLSDLKNIVFPEKMRQQSVDGIIATGRIPDDVATELQKYAVPVIFLNRNFNYERKFPTFCADPIDGVRKAVLYGIEHGHRHFWFCNRVEKRDSFLERLRTFQEEVMEKVPGFSLRFEFLTDNPSDKDGQFVSAMAEEWGRMEPGERPTFVIGDPKIIMAWTASLGLQCPRDISLMGTYELEMNNYMSPPLSVVDHDFEQIGFDAVRTIIEYIEKKMPVPPEKHRNDYPARVVERQSVRTLAVSARRCKA